MIILVVLFNDEGKPKGILTQTQYTSYMGKTWWSSTKLVQADEKEYENGNINISNINSYL